MRYHTSGGIKPSYTTVSRHGLRWREIPFGVSATEGRWGEGMPNNAVREAEIIHARSGIVSL